MSEDKATRSRSDHRWPWRAIKIAVSAVLLALLLVGLDRRALELAGGLPPGVLLASLGLMILGQVVAALRLLALLRIQGVEVGPGAALRLTFAGSFLSNFTPGTVGGDAGKALLMIRARIEPRIGVLAVLAERVIAFLTTVALTAVCLAATGLWRSAPEPIQQGALAALVATGGLAILAGLWRRRLLELARALISPIRRRLRVLDGSGAVLRRWLSSPVTWIAGTGLSALAFSSSVAGQWLLLRYLEIAIGPVTFTALVGIVYLVSLVPISLNGLGVREVSLVFLLTSVGAAEQAALVFALLTRLLGLLKTVPGALALLGSRAR